MKKKIFFFSLAILSAALIVICAVTGGIDARKMNAYNAQKAAIVDAAPKTVEGKMYYNRLTSAEQYVYENIAQALAEFDEFTPKMAFVPTEEQVRNAANALILDDPSVFYIDPNGFDFEDIEYWHTEAETQTQAQTQPPEETEPTVSDGSYSEETEGDGPPDIPIVTDPVTPETEPPETEGETEEETAEIIHQVIDGLYAKLKIPYIYSVSDAEIMSKRLSASLIKSDRVIANCTDDFQKALALNDYLSDISRNRVDTELYGTAYGALVSGGADGRGYALAYKLLLSRHGMVSHVAFGKYKGIESAWNVALLEGKYYNIDTYASDPELIVDEEVSDKMFTHAYFCVNDETLNKTHTLNDGCEVPKCTDTRNYYDIFSLHAQNETMLSNISEKLISASQSDEMFFEIYVTYTSDTGKILDTVKSAATTVLDGDVDVTLYIPIPGEQSYVFRLIHTPPPVQIEPPTTDTSEETTAVAE